eukprot:TRINITY_DN7417_c0_g1_i1.p1 TRINITY_DN7417_c0_g1~~TRINITY_DN7417_c0_g1_i1.p1  ORF type:complete len:292 (+),score=33.03 TRINITY_DN7417_c0_g1_i1:62-937(+)
MANPSLFVGGLASSVTETMLKGLFQGCGTIERVTMKRGYAFIQFVEPGALNLAVGYDGTVLAGKAIGVRVQSAENATGGSSQPHLPPPPIPDSPSLFVGGLTSTATEGDLMALFSDYGTVGAITMKGSFAFIQFLEPGAAEAACALDGCEYAGKTLGVRIQSPENAKPRRGDRGSKKPLKVTPPVAAPVAAVPPPNAKKVTAHPSLFIGGLSRTVTERDIMLLCAPHGVVASITMKAGYSFVEFELPGIANRVAALLDGFQLDGKTLGVRVQHHAPGPTARGATTARVRPY